MQLTQDNISLIKELNPIKDVMSDYGLIFNSSNKSLCPFHHESSGSFHYYPETSSYYCYGCGAGSKGKELKLKDGSIITDAGSDVIGFISNIEKVSFQDACKILMNRASIPIPNDKVNYEFEKLKDMIMSRNRIYYQNLINNPNAIEYLESRNITIDDIKKWRLGYVPHNDYSVKEIIRDRIVFAIQEDSTRDLKTIAFAYRKLDDTSNAPKYINDSSSKIYQKSNVLYGLSHARQSIKKKNYAIVMEGYIDVIRAHAVGLDNSVAVCGTSITKEQIKKLRSLTDQVFLWLDGDEAGLNSAIRNIPDFLNQGFSVMLVLSSGEDPADVFDRLHTYENVINFIRLNSKPAVQYTIDNLISSYDSIVYKERVKVLNQINPILQSIQKESDKLIFTSEIYKKLGLKY